MEKVYPHKCIKPTCDNNYEDNDPDSYYCPTCNEERLRIAKEIDAQFPPNRISSKPMSSLQMYDADPNKVKGFIRVKL